MLSYFYSSSFSKAYSSCGGCTHVRFNDDDRRRPAEQANSSDCLRGLDGEYKTIKVHKYSKDAADLFTPFPRQNARGGESLLWEHTSIIYSNPTERKEISRDKQMPAVHVSVTVRVGPCCSSCSSATSPRWGRTASGATPRGGCPAPPKESIDGYSRRVGARAGRTLWLVPVVFDEPPPGADGTRSESTLWTPGTSEGKIASWGFGIPETRLSHSGGSSSNSPPGLLTRLEGPPRKRSGSRLRRQSISALSARGKPPRPGITRGPTLADSDTGRKSSSTLKVIR